MTISDRQQDNYQSTVSEFTRQTEPNTCLAIALKNIIDELAERKDIPEMGVERDEVLEMVDYDPFLGCTSDFLPERLNPHLNTFNYEVVEERDLSLEELEYLLSNDDPSYPIVELDSRYLEWIHSQEEHYDSLPGTHGNRMPHTVIPFGFNDETVLLFDPLEDYYLTDVDSAALEVNPPQPLFYEWWSGETAPRWTLYCEQREQQTLDQVEGGDKR